MQNQNKTLTYPQNNTLSKHFNSPIQTSSLPFKAGISQKTAKILANWLIISLGLKVLLAGALFLIPEFNAHASEKQSLITPSAIIELTNKERSEANLVNLTQNEILAGAAMKKAEDILDNDYFAHTTPSGKPFYAWVHEAGYVYKSAGENLAISFIKSEDVVNAWMSSPLHKENLLDPQFTEIGVAVATGIFDNEETTVVVQLFGQPINGSSIPTSNPLPQATLGANDTIPSPDTTPLMQRINVLINLMLIIPISFLFIFLMERIFAHKQTATALVPQRALTARS